MLVVDFVDQLRGRFQRCRHKKSLELIANSIDLSIGTLVKFVAGQDLNTRSLRKIEEWCEKQEEI